MSRVSQGLPDVPVTSFCVDSALAGPGSAFFALGPDAARGWIRAAGLAGRVDGHDFIGEAISRGCRCVFLSRPVDDLPEAQVQPATFVLVKDTMKAMQELSGLA